MKFFNVVSKPNDQASEIGTISLTKKLKEAVREDDNKLIHPKSNNANSFGIWQDPDDENCYFVKESKHLGQLDNLQIDNNWLYMPTLSGIQKVRIFDTVNGKPVDYQVIGLEKQKLPFSFALKGSDIDGVFFEQVKKGEGNIGKEVKISHKPDKCQGQPTGWLNPVILQFSLDDNDMNFETEGKKEQDILKFIISHSALLLVEPHLDWSYDLRISFLKKLQERINESHHNKNNGENYNNNFSLFEYMLLGRDTSKKIPEVWKSSPWKPFLSLDLLGGEFYVERDDNQNQPVIYWKRPPDLSSNASWFAEFCLKQWVGTELTVEKEKLDLVQPPPAPRSSGASRGLMSFTVEDLEKAKSSCSYLLKHHPRFLESERNIYYWIVKVLEELKLNRQGEVVEDQCHWGSTEVIGNETEKKVNFDDVDFWNNFSARYVVPESPIFIKIPKVGNFLNPIDSINDGKRDFLMRLVNSLSSDICRNRTEIELHNRFDWWNKWYSILFEERWDVEIKYIDSLPGFILGQSCPGKAYLGSESRESQNWKPETMHF